jgi:hypothetical protein
LTGVPPTDALTRAMTVLNEQDDPLRPAHIVNPKIPFGVSEVLRKAMALNANHRPASAAIMRQLLDESDKIENIGDYETISDRQLPTNLFTQNTRLFTDQSQQQSEIKTEVLSPSQVGYGDSRETVLANKAENTVSGSSKHRYVIGAAVFCALLLVGFGMYAVSEMDTHSQNPVKIESGVSETKGTGFNQIDTNINSEFTTINPANEDANMAIDLNPLITDSSVKKDSKKSETPTQKSSETAKNPAKETKAPNGKEEPLIVEDDEEGNVKIYSDKIETDEVIVEANRMIFKKQPGKGGTFVQPIDPKVFQQLTPAQKRKLMRLRQMQRNFPRPPQPPPPTNPTPEN